LEDLFDLPLQKLPHHYYWKGQNKNLAMKKVLTINITELTMLCPGKVFHKLMIFELLGFF
jgi:hypothetical protein